MRNIALLLILLVLTGYSQKKLILKKMDGTTFSVHTNIIREITFEDILQDTIAWYTFNEHVKDTSGYENHGDPNGVYIFVKDRFDNAFGSLKAGAKHVALKNKDMFNFTGSFTVSCWVGYYEGKILDKGCYTVGVFTNKTRIILTSQDGSVQTINGTIELGSEFHHIIYIRDIEKDMISIYVDGQLDISIEDKSTSALENTNDLLIGSGPYGNLDELLICTKAIYP